MLKGEDRERALARLEIPMPDSPGDPPESAELLAALEKEFVLVRPKAKAKRCSWDCPVAQENIMGRLSCAADLMELGEIGQEQPSPDCPAHRKEKSDA